MKRSSSTKYYNRNEKDKEVRLATENDPLLLPSSSHSIINYQSNSVHNSNSSSSSSSSSSNNSNNRFLSSSLTTLQKRRHSSPFLSSFAPSLPPKATPATSNLFFRKIKSSITTRAPTITSMHSHSSRRGGIGSTSSSGTAKIEAAGRGTETNRDGSGNTSSSEVAGFASIRTPVSTDASSCGGIHRSAANTYPSRSYDPESCGESTVIATGTTTSLLSSSFEEGRTTDNTQSNVHNNYNGTQHNIRSARSHQLSSSIGSYQHNQLHHHPHLHSPQHSSSSQYHRHHHTDKLHEYYNERAKSIFSKHSNTNKDHREEPLVQVNPEVLAVRKKALKVYEPLTYTWLLFSVGFSICAALSMAKWTGILAKLPYWFLLLPCWSSHIALFICHISSAKTLFWFINEANNQRQRADSTDHIDRTEYLPLLQRALRFGLKTGSISFLLFIFEIMLCIHLEGNGSISLMVVFIPLWFIVGFGIIDGIICKTQHFVRVLSWMLALSFMVLCVLKVDYGSNFDDVLRLRTILGPVVAILAIALGSLTYILYGHLIGYFRLSDSQLNAGILYLIGLLVSSSVLGMILTMHLARPNIVAVRVAMVALAPLAIALMGLGAWAITRDEFDNLLRNGGQSSVQPWKLRLEKSGWTAVEGKGSTIIPMFGEVRYEPLDPSTRQKIVELCICCTCYPYEDEEEGIAHSSDYPTFTDSMPGLHVRSSAVDTF